MPDVPGVVPDGAVGGEDAGPGDVDERFLIDPNGVSFDNDHLSVGSRVQVVKGDFCGVEGELASEANKTYVVIRIAGVLSASVKVPKSYLRVI